MTPREKNILITVAAAGGLWLLNSTVYEPYARAVTDLNKNIDDAIKSRKDTDDLIDRKKRLAKVWTAMTAGGLKSDQYTAEAQAWDAVLTWADWAGVHVTDLKNEVPTETDQFQVIGLQATVTGSTASIAKLLWAIETANIPIRVTEFQVTPKKEGTDDLGVQLRMSTLCLKPAAEAKPARTANAVSARTVEARS